VIGTATAGNAQATVTFTAPVSDGGSAITGYTVISIPAGGVDSNAGTTSLNHVITGLTNGKSYTFTVKASNAAGTSAASAASNSVMINTGALQVYYIHVDQLDTPREITDTGGNVVWQWDNVDPSGNNMANENPAGLGKFSFNLRFPGQYFDRETNTHYNVNRDYDPAIGRYVESDPIGLAGGINTYNYVNGNSISFIDPLGLWVVYMGGTGSIVGALLGASAGGGFVFDNSGHWGTYTVVGVGGGNSVGGDASFGLSIGVMGALSSAPVTTISDFGGPFANSSVGLGLGLHVSVDGFYDPYTPTNFGEGLTIGEGVGGGLSVQATNTKVTPNTLTLDVQVFQKLIELILK
jgi:RHS repeat-associated protein